MNTVELKRLELLLPGSSGASSAAGGAWSTCRLQMQHLSIAAQLHSPVLSRAEPTTAQSPQHVARAGLCHPPAFSRAVASMAGCSGSTMTTELPAPTIWFQLHTALPGKQSLLKFSMPAACFRSWVFFSFLLFIFFFF